MRKKKEEDERWACGLLCGSIKHYFLMLSGAQKNLVSILRILYGILISYGILPLDDRLIFAFDAISFYSLQQIVGNVI
jgi:hypothetical protein